MDLGISGRRAIVCGSSRGLGRACAEALFRSGVEVVLNGRNHETLDAPAHELTAKTGTKAIAVPADLNMCEGRAKLHDACPQADVLTNNNGGPTFRVFRTLDSATMRIVASPSTSSCPDTSFPNVCRKVLRPTSKKTGASLDQIAQSWTDQVPADRLGDPDEFGNSCAFLCSVHASYITGQNILRDGGLYRSAF